MPAEPFRVEFHVGGGTKIGADITEDDAKRLFRDNRMWLRTAEPSDRHALGQVVAAVLHRFVADRDEPVTVTDRNGHAWIIASRGIVAIELNDPTDTGSAARRWGSPFERLAAPYSDPGARD
jgi:hypothetical protein